MELLERLLSFRVSSQKFLSIRQGANINLTYESFFSAPLLHLLFGVFRVRIQKRSISIVGICGRTMGSKTKIMQRCFQILRLMAIVSAMLLTGHSATAAEIETTTDPTTALQKDAQKIEPDKFDPAKLVSNPLPVYPADAVTRRLSGRVVLRLTVSRYGYLSNIVVVTSSGHKILDDAALHAVHYWDFDPAELGGEPIESTMLQPIRFRIR
jgi:TonB family protein